MDKFVKDLARKELIPIKILMFLIYGGQATLYPYFTVHLKSLGVSIRQTAIIFAVQPVIALLVAPMVGMFADKIGNFKLIFSFFLTFSAISANLLLLVPPVEQSEKLLYFNLLCDSNANSRIELNTDISCKLNHALNTTSYNTTIRFNCKHTCQSINEPYLPLFFKEDETNNLKECNDNGTSFNTIENTSFVFDLNLHNFYRTNSNLISEDLYKIGYNNSMHDALQCSCANCNINCTFASQESVTYCLDIPPKETFAMTFWTYLCIRLVVTLGIGLVNGLFDAASMTIIQELKADVGFQRFWSTVAMCLFAPVSGYFVDTFDTFRPCFFMYGILYLIAAITSLKLDLSMKLPSDNPLKNLAKLMKNPEVLLLLVQIAVLGICWGFLENFLFWFLESELGSNNLIMGLTVTVGSGTGLFMALVATWCTRKLGYVNVIILAFAAYTIRFIGYSYAKDAYTCLIFEMMENFTVTLLTVGVTMYCTELAPMEMLTTIMTLWNGLHIISGRAFGSLLGGFLVKNIGFRETFKYFAYISCSFGVFYALVYITWLRNWQKTHRKDSTESKKRGSTTISEEREEEAMKSEAFTSFPLHCSFDSPTIIHYIPDSPDFEFRRRAMSHIPVVRSNSLRQAYRTPRQAMSFSEGRTNLSHLSAVMENFQNNQEHNFHSQISPQTDTNVVMDSTTKF